MPFRNDFGDVVIPAGAIGNLGRIILTRNIPAELDAHYGGSIIACQLFGVPNAVYSYIALHQSGASLRLGHVAFIPGAVVTEAQCIQFGGLTYGLTNFGLENDVEVYFGNDANGTVARVFFQGPNESVIRADNGLHIRGPFDNGDGFIRDMRKRIATVEFNTDSGTFSAETVVGTITAARLLSGRVYELGCSFGFNTDTAGLRMRGRFREDGIAGTIINERQMVLATAATTTPYDFHLIKEYEPPSTEINKSFVLTGERLSAAGVLQREGVATSRISYLWIDYVHDA